MSVSDVSILVIGSRGMLGRAWCEYLQARGAAFDTVNRPELDLTRPDTIKQIVQPHYDTVINCAAWTDVDGAETHEAKAMAINGTGVGHLAERCHEISATLVHYSTDYVFNGKALTPYRVDEFRNPINTYGLSKAEGERLIVRSGCEHLIVRTSWLYAPWGKNFVRTMVRLMNTRDQLRVVNDQRGRPTSSQHLAAATWALLQKQAHGIFHVTDGGECTWFEFASVIARLLGTDCQVQPCTTDDFPTAAKRPAYSVLDLSKTESLIGPMPSWQDNLRNVIEQLEPIQA